MGVLGSEEVPSAGDGRGLAERSLGAHARASCVDVRSRMRWTLLTAAIFACLWLALDSAPALALTQRGHVFGRSFEGPLLGPSALAVNEASGAVYVADRAGERVEVFTPSKGSFLASEFAKVAAPEAIAVDNSEEEADPSRGDVYVVGTTQANLEKKKPRPDKILFKFDPEGKLIGQMEKTGLKSMKGVAVGVGGKLFVYGESGAGATIVRFDNAAENHRHGRIGSGAPGAETRGFAVDTEENFYVGHLNGAGTPVVAKLDKEGSVLSEQLDSESTRAVAVSLKSYSSNGVLEQNDAYLANVNTAGGEPASSVAAFGPKGFIQRFAAAGPKEGSAIGVDAKTGDVYVAAAGGVNVFSLEPPAAPRVDSLSAQYLAPPQGVSNAIKLNAQVDPAGAATSAYFEYGTASCATSPCTKTTEVPVIEGFGDRGISAEVQNLAPGNYYFRVVAKNKEGTAPNLEQTFPIAATVSELLDGRAWEMVSPPNKGGFEPEPIIAGGGTIQAARDGSAITYVADGPIPADGQPEGNRVPEPSQILSYRGAQGWASQSISTANTAGEGVREGSPQEYQAFSPNLSLALLQPFIGFQETSPFAQPPLSPRQRFEVGRKVVTEGCAEASPSKTGEYEDENCTKKVTTPKTGLYEDLGQEKTIYLRNDAPLLPEAGEREDYEAATQNGTTMKNPGYLAVVTEANALGVLGGEKQGEAQFAGGVQAGIALMAATPDLSHGVFKSYRASPGLYEWGPNPKAKLKPNPLLPNPLLQLVSVLPKNEKGEEPRASPNAVLGDQPTLRHSISNSGERVFWSLPSGGETNLFVRDTKTHETLQLDAVASGTGAGTPGATFQTASADGTLVFFTDTQRLTADSKALPGSPPQLDLYVFKLSPQGEPLSGTLTDLTPGGVNGESAAVQGLVGGGGVLGASEDGSYVYFVANGALASGDVPGNCNAVIEGQERNRTCNLYVRHFNGTEWEGPKLVAALSSEDAPTWGGSGFIGDLKSMTSRVSPSGHYLAFMSNRSLTEYNNEDATSKEPDEEVFLYDAIGKRLVCASCNPSGARPAGLFDPGVGHEVPGPEAEGLGLVVDRSDIWGPKNPKVDHWLAGNVPGWTPVGLERAIYQSHYLSDSGRLFFNSPDHLVPAATGVKEKVFEYEPNGVGGCHSEGGCVGLLSAPNNAGEPNRERESAFLDASESGEDVFFLTAAKLTPGDVDTNYDVYDARVCSQAPTFSCLPAPGLGSPGCKGENACKGAPPPGLSLTAPASQSVPAPGKPASVAVRGAKEAGKPKPRLTRAQLLAKALKACRTKYKAKTKRRQRAACEARARKTYGHTGSHKRPAGHKR